MPVAFCCVQFWDKVEEVRSQPSSHSSLGFPETQEPQQISVHAKLLIVKVPFRFSKSFFPTNYYLVKTLLLKKNSLQNATFVDVLSGAYNILP